MGQLDQWVAEFEVQVRCSSCQRQFAREIGFLRTHASFPCPNCAGEVQVQSAPLAQVAATMGESFASLKRNCSKPFAPRGWLQI
jgi:predicted RNA-binding Zn-ribbon protein involved in translation (DUF1610 family)